MKYPHYPNGEPPNLRTVKVKCCASCEHSYEFDLDDLRCGKFPVVHAKHVQRDFAIDPFEVCDAHEEAT